jgi:hypothetical protein
MDSKFALPFKYRSDKHLYRSKHRELLEELYAEMPEGVAGEEGRRRKRELESIFTKIFKRYADSFWISHEDEEAPIFKEKDQDPLKSVELEQSIKKLTESYHQCKGLELNLKDIRLA